jgi:glutaredoxin
MKKILFPIVILAVIIVAGILIYGSTKGEEKNGDQQINTETEQTENDQKNNSAVEESTKTDNTVAILFYSSACSHCKNTNDWLEENNVKEKVKFDHLEVSSSRDNNALLIEKAKSCGIEEIGVPFLYDVEKNECISGSDKIIKYFESKI